MKKLTPYFTLFYALFFVACSKKSDTDGEGSAKKRGTPPTIEWQKSFDMGTVSSIQQTKDLGYVFIDGDANAFGIVKLDPTGNIQWNKRYGGATPSIYNPDLASAIRQTADGGYVVAGYTISNDGNVSGNHGERDFWVVKLGANGDLQWQKCLGGSENDVAEDIQQTSDGGYIVVGYTQSNDGDVVGREKLSSSCWVVKLNDKGVMVWQKSFNNLARTTTPSDYGESVQQTNDGGYIIASTSYGRKNLMSQETTYWILKLSANGTLEWEKDMGGKWGQEDVWSIQQTADNGYIVGGGTYSNDGNVSGNNGYLDFWIVKLNSKGDMQWQKCLGGTRLEMGGIVQQTTDGGYIVAGSSESKDKDVTGYHGGNGGDAWLVKLSENGTIQWERCYGGTDEDGARAIKQTIDGGYIMAGYGHSRDGDVKRTVPNSCWIVKLKF